jgi:hypothetical protein
VFAMGERLQWASGTVATVVGRVVPYPVDIYRVELDCEELNDGRDGDTTGGDRIKI